MFSGCDWVLFRSHFPPLRPRALGCWSDNNLLSTPVCNVNAPSPRCLITLGVVYSWAGAGPLIPVLPNWKTNPPRDYMAFSGQGKVRAESAHASPAGGLAGWLNVICPLGQFVEGNWLILLPSSGEECTPPIV